MADKQERPEEDLRGRERIKGFFLPLCLVGVFYPMHMEEPLHILKSLPEKIEGALENSS